MNHCIHNITIDSLFGECFLALVFDHLQRRKARRSCHVIEVNVDRADGGGGGEYLTEKKLISFPFFVLNNKQ